MAAGRDMIARLVLTLTDRATSGLRALQSRLSGLASMARRIAGIGLLAGAFSLAGPMQQAAAFDDVLRQTAITAGRSGAAVEQMIDEMRRRYEALAIATGQRSRAIAEAGAQLIAAGLDPTLIERLLPTLARTATATGATLQDLSSTAIALNQNLRIGPEQMADALAALAQAGKEGRFELRDMARSFPQLTAAAEALGLRGREGVNSLAAMLQVARRGAATADEAANNLANFLQKISSPETVKHFREMGVDLERVLADAAGRGINPIEAVVQKIREITKGNMFRVGNLFGDLQVLNFLRPMLRAEGVQEYLRVLEAAARAEAGLINRDFESRFRGLYIQMELVSERVGQLGRRLAVALGSNLPAVNEALKATQALLADLDARFPGLVDSTVSWGGSLLLVAGALGLVLPILFRGLGFLLRPLGLLRYAWIALVAVMKLAALAIGAVFGPIGLAVAAIAALGAAGVALRLNWGRIGPWFAGLWRDVQQHFTSFVAWVDSWTEGAATAAIGKFKAAWSGLTGFFTDLWRDIRQIFDAALAPILAVIDRIDRAIDRGREFQRGDAPLTPEQRRQNWRDRGRLGNVPGGAEPQSAPAPDRRSELHGRIEIALAPGLVLRRGETDTPGVTIGADRGLMLRPV